MTESETYILALDQGTTSSRSILFDRKGNPAATAQEEFKQHYPKSGWVEHDAHDIWNSQLNTLQGVLDQVDDAASRVEAIGITNQRETTVVWNRETGEPIHHAIVWQDRRTSDFCRTLKEKGLEKSVTEKTGLRLDPYFAGTKVKWILDHVDGARAEAEEGKLAFGTVDSWLLWNLTQGDVHATDVTNACRTLLYNLQTGSWDKELCDLFSIPMSMLPEVHACTECFGHVHEDLPLAGTPICGIAGDQHAALFGQSCFKPGMAKSTYGTGSFLLMNVGTERVNSENNLLSTIAWKIGDETEYALEGSVFIAGAAVQWVRDELKMVDSAEELNEVAASVEDTNGLYLVPAFTGLGAPHWDPYARGAMVGITRGTNRAHVCRAALEAIAFQTVDLMEAMEKDSGIQLKEMRVDGGAANSDILLQFQADLLQEDVVRPRYLETTALGAAYLAGLSVGFWKSKEDIQSQWEEDRTFSPEKSPEDIRPLLKGWRKAVERSKDWIETDSESPS